MFISGCIKKSSSESKSPVMSPKISYKVSCGDKITRDTTLTSDLLNCQGNGIIIDANDITFDCQGHTIDGINASDSYGIYISEKLGVTIKNCIVKEFNYGILLEFSNGKNTIVNNTASYNYADGIYILDSNNVAIVKNMVSNNGDDGIEFYKSNNTNITNNKVSNNDEGLKFTHSNNNIVMNNIASNNNDGIILSYSSNDTIVNNTVSNNERGIRLHYADSNIITNNIAPNNEYGISVLDSSNNNLLSDNDASLSKTGFYFTISATGNYGNGNLGSVVDYDNNVDFHSS